MKSKSILLLSALLLAAIFVQAGDRTIVVRPSKPTPKSKTSVTCQNDSLVVTPSSDATTIHVTVRDLDGGVISHQMLSANIETSVSVETPDEGGEDPVLEIGDDEGTVYEE